MAGNRVLRTTRERRRGAKQAPEPTLPFGVSVAVEVAAKLAARLVAAALRSFDVVAQVEVVARDEVVVRGRAGQSVSGFTQCWLSSVCIQDTSTGDCRRDQTNKQSIHLQQLGIINLPSSSADCTGWRAVTSAASDTEAWLARVPKGS